MIVIDHVELERIDSKSGKTVRELFEAYFENGWRDFSAFYDSWDFNSVRKFEESPEEVFVGGRLRWGGDDVGAAKKRLLTWVTGELSAEPITYLEFGVRAGVSMRWVSGAQQHSDSRFHGFDTFEGLPEAWVPAWGGRAVGGARLRGEMAVGMPVFEDKRICLYKGLCQKTLPQFLRDNPPNGRLFVNIDTDIYSAALFILTSIHPYLKPHDILYFDEFHDELNEFAAFNDYVRSYYTRDRFRLLGRAYDAYVFGVT